MLIDSDMTELTLGKAVLGGGRTNIIPVTICEQELVR